MKEKNVSIFDGTNVITLSAHPNIVDTVEIYEKISPKHMDTTTGKILTSDRMLINKILTLQIQRKITLWITLLPV